MKLSSKRKKTAATTTKSSSTTSKQQTQKTKHPARAHLNSNKVVINHMKKTPLISHLSTYSLSTPSSPASAPQSVNSS